MNMNNEGQIINKPSIIVEKILIDRGYKGSQLYGVENAIAIEAFLAGMKYQQELQEINVINKKSTSLGCESRYAKSSLRM